MIWKSIAGFLLLGAWLAPLRARAQADVKPQSRSIAVVVHDKHGKPLAALNKADMELLVDGRPASITSLTSEGNKPLLLGLVIDTSKPQEQVVPEEKAPVKAFIDSYLGKDGDQAFVIHFDRQIELMQDLTSDHALLHSAMDDLQPANSEDVDEDTSSSGKDDPDDHERRALASGERLYDGVFLACDEILRKPNGRKVLVVVSGGMDHGSKESFASAVEAAQRSGVAVYTIYVPGEQEKVEQHGQNNPNGQKRRSGGGIGYPGGGGWPGGGQSGGHSRRETLPHEDGRKILLEMAQKTGGAMFEAKKKDEIGSVLNDIMQYLQDEYLLTFELDPQLTGEFHRVSLTSHGGSDKVQATQAFYTAH